MKKFFNENMFTVLYTGIASLLTFKFITSEEGRANLYEIMTLSMLKYSLFLITIFILTKMLAGLDKNIKDDLFADKYTTTATWIAIVLSLSLLK